MTPGHGARISCRSARCARSQGGRVRRGRPAAPVDKCSKRRGMDPLPRPRRGVPTTGVAPPRAQPPILPNRQGRGHGRSLTSAKIQSG